MADRRQRVLNILSQLNPMDEQVRRDFSKGFATDYGIGREDTQTAYYRQRGLDGEQKESTRWNSLTGTHLLGTRINELRGKTTPSKRQALAENDMNLRGTIAHKGGQLVGSVANDLTQDTTRSIYWLLNAAQATGEVLNEQLLSRAVPELYRKSPVQNPSAPFKIEDNKKVPNYLSVKDKGGKAEMLKQGYAKVIDDRVTPSRGYSIDEFGDLQKRNYDPGFIQALAIPTGVAINSGLGLLTPFGGAEGYKAALPSQEDPTKTQNVLGEVGLKYFMGRTGNLLPYNEFKQVRPDVSREEYNAYQQFKYDKREDYNPLDGDISMLAGALRATTDGIHGPEVQFLGRSLPATTGVTPFLASMIGTAVGARRGQRSQQAVKGGLIGGTTGLLAGHVTGSIIEDERRRRNAVENQIQGGSAEQYL